VHGKYSGWSVVRSASLAKGGTSKNRPSSHLHKVPTRSKKVSPRTSQTSLVYHADPSVSTLKLVHMSFSCTQWHETFEADLDVFVESKIPTDFETK
jgi:hypothetical protein